jgi:serine/threonine-protein kinase
VSALKKAKNPPFADKYTVERVLGRGGMGTVFEARHARLGHRVAIKVLGEELRVHPDLVKRFEREARAAGALSSPHAVRIFDIDQTDDGTPFMVMELLSGCDLARLLERHGAQPVGLAVRWMIEACDAIGEAHSLGIVHRDIKPSNLYLSEETGSIKVLDFGIAKRVAAKEASITQGLAPLGTPQYMSPEQVRCAKDVDARSDIWSIGITLYELVTGRPPFNHDVPQACIAAIAADPVPDPRTFRPDLPDDLVVVIMRALDKDPAGRFASVDELVEALRPFADATVPAPHVRVAATSGARRVFRKEDTTIGEAAEASGADVALQIRRSGPHRRGASMSSVPPAVSRAAATLRSRRIRSSLAVVSAAVLGLAALVATPHCVGSRIERASSHAAQTAPVAPVTARPAPVAIAEAHLAEADETAIELPESDEPQAAPDTTAAPADSSSAVRLAPKPVASAPPRLRPTAPARVIGSEPLVHGGLSNPGF